MSYSFGRALRVTIFGQSHGPAIGAVIDGLPAGLHLDMDAVSRFMARRAPGGALSTARREADAPRVIAGLDAGGATCGAPLAAIIENTDSRSRDYEGLRRTPRPMHADFPASVKYGEHFDIRGGGQFSGRLTAPLCFVGAVAMQALASRGVYVGAHIASIGSVHDDPFDAASVSVETFAEIASRSLPVIDDACADAMRSEIEAARSEGDSVGGVVECAVIGMPCGAGEPIFDSVESALARVLFGIPAVKGVDFGAGFASAAMRGSEHNDSYTVDGGAVRTATNRHGGVLGGITTGMPITFRAAFKPTPSIARVQTTVDVAEMREAELEIAGRHDPCIVVRAVPAVEAAAAAVMLDLLVERDGRDHWI